jgi:cytochrome c oxidase cbb3-type subunit 4
MQGVGAEMDINGLRGVILITLMISFVGLWVWAWSRKRKPAFHEASMLPLEEDNGQVPNQMDPEDGKGSESC